MKYIVKPLAVVLAVALLVSVPASTASALIPFYGAWQNLDFDGSHQTMWVKSSSTSTAIFYFDDGASICGRDGEGHPIYPFHGDGRGFLTRAGVLRVSMLGTCLANPPYVVGRFQSSFTYNPATDTLLEENGVCWERTGTDNCSPS